MPTPRRRHPDPATGSRAPFRSSLADAAWAVEDRFVWGVADVFRALVEAIREEVELWGRPARAAALAGTIVLAGAGVAAGVIVSDPSGDGGQSGPEIVRVSPPPVPTTPSAKAAEATGSPVLQGTTPNFSEEQGGGVTKAEAATEAPTSQIAANATQVQEPDGASAAGGGSEIAGPAAIAVARKFAGAFVLYETGRNTAAVRTAFQATATPELSKALLQRPPRLPADVKVPKAKVLNVVAGPSHGDTYTLSVSLLRVGVTSELRLDMQKTPSGNSPNAAGGSAGSDKVHWLVTDVLG